MQLASWEETPEQQQQTGDGSPLRQELLMRLQLGSLDPAGAMNTAPTAAAACLAELAGESSSRQLQLPAELLLEAVATGEHGLQQQFTAWQQPEPGTSATTTMPSGAHSLQPLLLLLGRAALSEQQRGMLLVAAAREAARGGNATCMLHLVGRAEAGQQAGSGLAHGKSSPEAAVGLLLRLQHLRLRRLSAASADGDSGSAWRLLLDAQGSTMAAAVAPAAAQLLLAIQQPEAGISTAEVAAAVHSACLPVLASSTSASSFGLLEQQLLQGAQQQPGLGVAVQYAALKAAVAAAPNSARHWWQLATWMHQLPQQQQQQQQQQAAAQATFASSCRALAIAAASGTSSSDGYAAMPLLLQVLQLLTQQDNFIPPADALAQLAAIPAHAWLPVVPHLLSQLANGTADDSQGTPQQQQQQQQLLTDLLLHVAEAAPCQVLLPTTVAAAAQPVPAASGKATSLLQLPGAQLAGLLTELQQRHPLLAGQLSVLTAEASRLAVLPEEHWHSVLLEAAATAAKRLQGQHKKSVPAAAGSSTDAAAAAGEDGYLAAMAPVLLCLQQQLRAAEAAAPETPHEQRFHQQQLPRLRLLVQQLSEPLANSPAAAPVAGKAVAASDASSGRSSSSVTTTSSSQPRQKALALLRGAASDLAASLRSKQLTLAYVAPALAQLTDTGIPMPGSSAGSAPLGVHVRPPAAGGAPSAAAGAAPVAVASVAGEVVVLPTKTRPKRLRFLGSDGVQQTFLLKVTAATAALGVASAWRSLHERQAACSHACASGSLCLLPDHALRRLSSAGSGGPPGRRSPHAAAARLRLRAASRRRRAWRHASRAVL